MASNNTHWHVVYQELIRLLIFFAENNPDPGGAFWNRLNEDYYFLQDNSWFKKNGSIRNATKVDPIQIFTSFNSAKLIESKRTERIKHYFRLLSPRSKPDFDIDNIDFSGCPAPMAVNLLTFRDTTIQDEIWETFLHISKGGQDALTKEIFNRVKAWYGVNIISFTIFLFWIDSSNFLPLDRNTAAFIEANRKMDELDSKGKPSIYSYEGYKSLLTAKNTSIYRTIANRSRIGAGIGSDDTPENISVKNYFGLERADTIMESSPGCRIIAIKPKTKCNPGLLKVLSEEQLYLLHDAYKIHDDGKISYAPQMGIELYKMHELTIDVNAIVGKNGCGKSSLIELFLAALNNIAYKKYQNKEFTSEGEYPPEYIKKLEVELYIKTKTIYKISLHGKNIKILEYKLDGTIYEPDREMDILDLPLTDLFYSIIINYSHYALNSEHLRPWLRALFHKNDAYQLPIVLDPFRDKGNIDINTQGDLAKSRLLANLLEMQGDDNTEMNFRKLTDFQEAVTLKLSLREEKVKYVYEYRLTKKKLTEISDHKAILRRVFTVFDLPQDLIKHVGRSTMEGKALVYIFRKLLSIARTYPIYKKRHYKKLGFKDLDNYLNALKRDPSHIAYKLKQAINYLKYSHLQRAKKSDENIEKLSQIINSIKGDGSLKTIELIPPSFFSVDIVLASQNNRGKEYEEKEPSLFDGLSSGEKQQIYSINAIIYHLRNIHSLFDSIEDSLIRYPYITIVLDEIELYFHPELQRNFIIKLIKSIDKIDLSNINGINLVFVTHSPFILSDIPRSTVLFLEMDDKTGKAVPGLNKPYTFGANIHELLSNGFFMHQTIGAFAKEKIGYMVDFCQRSMKEGKDDKDYLKRIRDDYSLKKDEFHFICNNIGEGYIKGILKNHLQQLEATFIDKERLIEDRIQRLEQEINHLKTLQDEKNRLS